jgi:Na+/H+ antiporter
VQVFRLVKDPVLLITISFLIPYVAYLPAERLQVSGVLAAVAAGIYGGWKGPELLSASTRLNAVAVWSMLVFLLNCILFIVIGLQLPEVVGKLGQYTTGQLAAYGAITSAVVILVRPVWVFPASWLPRLLSKRLRERDPIPPARQIMIVAWSGMRGVVSLAAALALPMTFSNGQPFPQRNFVIFLTFCVILSTLVLQGLSLPLIVRWLGVSERHDETHERNARLKLAHAALAHLNKVAEQKSRHEGALQQITSVYQDRIEDLTDELAEVLGWSDHREQWVASRRLRLETLEAERSELIKLRRGHQVNEELMHKIERELDLEEERLRA